MTTQFIELETINDQELHAANAGSLLTPCQFLGGVQTGPAAKAVGVDLGNQGAGAYAIGAMVGEGKKTRNR